MRLKAGYWISALVITLSHTQYALAESHKLSKTVRQDEFLEQEWKFEIQPQGFPLLPASKELPKEPAEGPAERRRYIMHVSTAHLNPKMIFGDNNYWMQYQTKEAGNYFLIIHPKYKSCFENARKKFDEMQLVVFSNGDYEGWSGVMVERMRQCMGNWSATGGKLPGWRK